MTDKLHSRHVEPRLREALEDSPAVLIHGPRQCGKTTLARIAGGAGGHGYYSFDNESTLNSALEDPMGFVGALPPRAILDEVQRAPGILHALKLAIDTDRAPGRFILTGSANILRMKDAKESLAGRMEIIDLHPFSQCEMADVKPQFLDRILAARPAMPQKASSAAPPELAERMVAGGYPPAVARAAEPRRIAWYKNYVQEVTESDTLELERIRIAEAVGQMLEAAAAQTAQLVSIDGLATTLGRARVTVEAYLALLENMFLVERLPAYSGRQLTRLVKAPKVHLCDTGIACRLIGANSAILNRDRALRGHMLETFVFRELARQASGHPREHRFSHYRTKDDVEVDIVVERRDAAKVAGIEVKASATVRSEHFKGLRKMREALGERFAAGVVLYEGQESASFGDRLHAAPISSLWQDGGA